MENEKIEIDVLIEFKEYLKLSYINLFKKLWFLLIICAVGIVYILSSAKNPTSYNTLISILPIIFIITVLIISVYWSVKRSMKTSPVLSRKIKYDFSENQIEVTGNSFESRMNWEMIIKAEEKANFILLYATQRTAYMLPLRCFQNARQIKEFKELVRKKLGDKAKLKNS